MTLKNILLVFLEFLISWQFKLLTSLSLVIAKTLTTLFGDAFAQLLECIEKRCVAHWSCCGVCMLCAPLTLGIICWQDNLVNRLVHN